MTKEKQSKEDLLMNYTKTYNQNKSYYEKKFKILKEEEKTITNSYSCLVDIKYHEKTIHELHLFYNTKKKFLINKLEEFKKIIEKENKEFNEYYITSDYTSEKALPFHNIKNKSLLFTNLNSPRHVDYLLLFKNKNQEQQIKSLNTVQKVTESEMMLKSFRVEEELSIYMDPVFFI